MSAVGPGVRDERQSLEEAARRGDARLAAMSATGRIDWALANLPGRAVLTSSFGAQSAVSLHMVTRADPGIAVILIDTGYLFPETYRFIDTLQARLALDLRVYRPARSAAWQEARHGRRWERGREALEDYNRENKVEPMRRALRELDAGVWFAGLRRGQAESRAATPFLVASAGRFKVHPLADWSDRDVYRYLQRHDLPYHPLWERGYVSIGDVHTTRPVQEVEDPSATRFFGLKRECGIHEIDLSTL